MFCSFETNGMPYYDPFLLELASNQVFYHFFTVVITHTCIHTHTHTLTHTTHSHTSTPTHPHTHHIPTHTPHTHAHTLTHTHSFSTMFMRIISHHMPDTKLTLCWNISNVVLFSVDVDVWMLPLLFLSSLLIFALLVICFPPAVLF